MQNEPFGPWQALSSAGSPGGVVGLKCQLLHLFLRFLFVLIAGLASCLGMVGNGIQCEVRACAVTGTAFFFQSWHSRSHS